MFRTLTHQAVRRSTGEMAMRRDDARAGSVAPRAAMLSAFATVMGECMAHNNGVLVGYRSLLIVATISVLRHTSILPCLFFFPTHLCSHLLYSFLISHPASTLQSDTPTSRPEVSWRPHRLITLATNRAGSKQTATSRHYPPFRHLPHHNVAPSHLHPLHPFIPSLSPPPPLSTSPPTMLPLLLSTPPPSSRKTWRAHALSRADALSPPTPHRTYTRLLSSVFLRESRTYQLGYALSSLLNTWNDAEYELGERVAARITLSQADLRSLGIGVGGLPYADTRVQSAFRAAIALLPEGSSMAQSPADSASDYAAGHAFDDRFDWSASPARSTPGGDSGVRERWGVHRPERAWVARCACRRHSSALAVVVAEAFSARRVARMSWRVWEEEARWRKLAAMLGGKVGGEEIGDEGGEEGLREGSEEAPKLLSPKEIAQRVSLPRQPS